MMIIFSRGGGGKKMQGKWNCLSDKKYSHNHEAITRGNPTIMRQSLEAILYSDHNPWPKTRLPLLKQWHCYILPLLFCCRIPQSEDEREQDGHQLPKPGTNSSATSTPPTFIQSFLSAFHRWSVLRCYEWKETSVNWPQEWRAYLRGDYDHWL